MPEKIEFEQDIALKIAYDMKDVEQYNNKKELLKFLGLPHASGNSRKRINKIGEINAGGICCYTTFCHIDFYAKTISYLRFFVITFKPYTNIHIKQ